MTTRHSPRFYRVLGAVAVNPLVTRLHPVVYRLTGGRWLVGRSLGITNVIVETVGRRSGRAREIPLYAFEDGPRLVVIGSNGGRGRLPEWVANLRARPELRVRVGRELRLVTASEPEGDERARLWRLAATAYPGYDQYQAGTPYPIPVVVLAPRADG